MINTLYMRQFFDNIINIAQTYPKYVCLFSGAVSSLMFAPIFLPFASFFLSFLAYYSQQALSRKQIFILGTCFGFGHFFAGLYWISIAPLVFAKEFWWAAILALFGIPGVLSLLIGFVACGANLFRSTRFFYSSFIIIWILIEWLRCWLFTGFPWNLLGYAFGFNLELSQAASIFGVLGLSIIVLYISIMPTFLFLKQNKLFLGHVIIGLAILIVMYVFGHFRLQDNPTEFTDVSVRLVQPSIPQEKKWDVDEFLVGFKKHLQLSQQQTSSKPGLLIWSESALPIDINKNSAVLNVIADCLEEGQILLTGATNQDQYQQAQYVGMYAINDYGVIIGQYHKTHLVPFGEYVPWKSVLPIRKLTYGLLDFTAGKGEQKLQLLGLKISPLICYEIIFPQEVRLKSLDADVIINITNDAWFGRSIGTYQHFYTARMRSIENGLPLLRIANNGISAIIDGLGRILQNTEIDQVGFLENYVPKKLTRLTIWSRHSTLAIFLLLLAISALASFKVK